jgi:hypothetical protein
MSKEYKIEVCVKEWHTVYVDADGIADAEDEAYKTGFDSANASHVDVEILDIRRNNE